MKRDYDGVIKYTTRTSSAPHKTSRVPQIKRRVGEGVLATSSEPKTKQKSTR